MYEFKTVDLLKLPRIMRHSGLPVGAAIMKKWLHGGARRKRPVSNPVSKRGSDQYFTEYDVETVKMSWVAGFPRAASQIEKLHKTKYLFSLGARLNLLDYLRGKRGPSEHRKTVKCVPCQRKTRFGFKPSNPKAFTDRHWFKIQAVDVGAHYDKLDDLKASLGRFSIVATPSGYVEPIDSDFKITVTHVGLYVVDSFDFIGKQSLGWWNMVDETVDKRTLSTVAGGWNPTNYGVWKNPPDKKDGWVFLKNKHFNEYRNSTSRGYDFDIFSDIQVHQLKPAFTFTEKATLADNERERERKAEKFRRVGGGVR